MSLAFLRRFVYCFVLVSFVNSSLADQRTDKEYINETKRIMSLNPVKSMREDVLAGQFKVFVFYDRGGRHIPGFSEQDASHLSKACEVIGMDGVGDVIYSDAHFKYYEAYIDFAVKYNQQMLKICVCKEADSNEKSG